MARFCTTLGFGMLILSVFTWSTIAQTIDERLQQFTTSFVRKMSLESCSD
jgi:type II secretory pathway component PulM